MSVFLIARQWARLELSHFAKGRNTVRVSLRTGILLCGLCLAVPASADVIYFKQENVHKDLEKTGWGKDVRRGGETYRAFQGRITEVLPARRGDSKPRIRFEPAQVSEVRGEVKIEWLKPRQSFEHYGFSHLDPEVDGLQDLRWMFSNRDVLVTAMAGGRTVTIGQEPFHTYFLFAGGVDVRARLSRLKAESLDSFKGLLKGGKLKPIDSAVERSNLQEGWLVNWLRRGDSMTNAERAGRIQWVFANGRVDGTPDFAPALFGFHPLILETDIWELVYSLLRAAAQDYRYTNALNPAGPFGLGVDLIDDGRGKQKQRVPKFFLVCVNAIVALCDQVQEDHPGARQMGYMAREGVLSALEGAQVGRHDASDLPSAPSAGSSPLSQANEWAGLTTKLRTDPGDLAFVALMVIVKRNSWQVARHDTQEHRRLDENWDGMDDSERPSRPRAGERLTHALLGLASDPDDSIEARAGDRIRLMNVKNVPGYGTTTELKTRLMKTLDHLCAGPDREAFLHHVTDILVESAAAGELRRDSSGGYLRDESGQLIEDTHAVSVREFAQIVLGRAGYANLDVMKDAVDRLFALALMGESGDEERDPLLGMIRRDAIASLAHLASLGERSKLNRRLPNDGIDDELTDAIGDYEAVSNIVKERVNEIIQDQLYGFGGEAERRFFGQVGLMTRAKPSRHLERHAESFATHMRERLPTVADADKRIKERVKLLRKLLAN